MAKTAQKSRRGARKGAVRVSTARNAKRTAKRPTKAAAKPKRAAKGANKSAKPAARKSAKPASKRANANLPMVAFIGVGHMAEAMVASALKSGWPRERIILTHRRPERRAELQKRFKIKVGDDNLAAVRAANTVVLAVRPQDFDGLLQTLRPAFRPDHTLVSIAAALMVHWFKSRLPEGMQVIRVTPPPTAWVGAGATLLSCDPGVPASKKRAVERLVAGTCERTEWVPDEMMEPITAMALGLTPYTCFLLKNLIEIGVEQGMKPEYARKMVMEGAWATARLLKAGLMQPEEIINTVATREGLTWSAIHTMEAHKVPQGIRAGVRAMTGRSYELRGEPIPPDYQGFSR